MAVCNNRTIYQLTSLKTLPPLSLYFKFSPFIQYYRICAMSSVSWYFFMSPFMLSLHLFFGRPLLLLPETSSLSDFVQMWLGSRLKQSSNHFVFCFLGKFQQVSRAPPSRCLMWSNLVFPLAHLNILISAEFCLFSSFFFSAQMKS